jgi:hypothetical protein
LDPSGRRSIFVNVEANFGRAFSFEMLTTAWAIKNGKWEMPLSAVLDRCANDIGEVMAEIYFTDGQGRRVRLLHPATVKRQGELFTEWDDIRTAPRQHMQMSFQQKRKSIVGECRQLKTDMDSYNDAHSDAAPIQISFDFHYGPCRT